MNLKFSDSCMQATFDAMKMYNQSKLIEKQKDTIFKQSKKVKLLKAKYKN